MTTPIPLTAVLKDRDLTVARNDVAPIPRIENTEDVCVSTNCYSQSPNFRNKHDPRFQGHDSIKRDVGTKDL